MALWKNNYTEGESCCFVFRKTIPTSSFCELIVASNQNQDVYPSPRPPLPERSSSGALETWPNSQSSESEHTSPSSAPPEPPSEACSYTESRPVQNAGKYKVLYCLINFLLFHFLWKLSWTKDSLKLLPIIDNFCHKFSVFWGRPNFLADIQPKSSSEFPRNFPKIVYKFLQFKILREKICKICLNIFLV